MRAYRTSSAVQRVRLAFFGCLCTILLGCSRSEPTSIQNYTQWFQQPEHGFVKAQKVHDLNYHLQYMPPQYLAVSELLKSDSLDAGALDSLVDYYSQSTYFMLRFFPSRESTQTQTIDLIAGTSIDYEAYRERLDMLYFHLGENMKLISGDDTVHPTLFHYERGFDATAIQRVIFAFPKSNAELRHVVLMYDDMIFNSGIQKYQFDIHELKIPKIPRVS